MMLALGAVLRTVGGRDAIAAAEQVCAVVPARAALLSKTVGQEIAVREVGRGSGEPRGSGDEEVVATAMATAKIFVFGLCHAVMAHCTVPDTTGALTTAAQGVDNEVSGAEQWARLWPSTRGALLAVTDVPPAAANTAFRQKLLQLQHGCIECLTLAVQAALVDEGGAARMEARQTALSLRQGTRTAAEVARQLLGMIPCTEGRGPQKGRKKGCTVKTY